MSETKFHTRTKLLAEMILLHVLVFMFLEGRQEYKIF
jgi:hypothetical protein